MGKGKKRRKKKEKIANLVVSLDETAAKASSEFMPEACGYLRHHCAASSSALTRHFFLVVLRKTIIKTFVE